jgi:hypothetical protein
MNAIRNGLELNKGLVVVWAVVTVLLAAVFLASAPFELLLGESAFARIGTIHGMLATVGVIFGTATGYLGWRLFSGKLHAYADLRWLSVISTIFATLTIMFGNWIYIAYRGAGGPREFFLQEFPEVHEIFFEFKEFIALFTLPIALASTYVLWTYRDSLPHDRDLRTAVGMFIAIGWSVLMIAYILGAGITKLRPV